MSDKKNRFYQKSEPIQNYNPSPKLQSFSIRSLEQINGRRLNEFPRFRTQNDPSIRIGQVPEFHKFQSNDVFQCLLKNKLQISNEDKRSSRKMNQKENIKNNNSRNEERLEEKIRQNIYNNSNQPMIKNASDLIPTMPETHYDRDKNSPTNEGLFRDVDKDNSDIARMKFKMKVEELRVSEDGMVC